MRRVATSARVATRCSALDTTLPASSPPASPLPSFNPFTTPRGRATVYKLGKHKPSPSNPFHPVSSVEMVGVVVRGRERDMGVK